MMRTRMDDLRSLLEELKRRKVVPAAELYRQVEELWAGADPELAAVGR